MWGAWSFRCCGCSLYCFFWGVGASNEYQDCFNKIGQFLRNRCHIDPSTTKHRSYTLQVRSLSTSHKKAELDKMITGDIITEVIEPTDWINSIVSSVNDTADGENKFRLCLDPKDRNKHFRREYYYSTTVNAISLSLHGKNYFLVVDTTNGYGYVELDHESGLLFTLNTPFGRCRFKRLPHVMVVSQDIFQQK